MAKPWENYQPSTSQPVVQSGPWEQYADPIAEVKSQSGSPLLLSQDDPAIEQDDVSRFKSLMLQRAKGDQGLDEEIAFLQSKLSKQQSQREPRVSPQVARPEDQAPWLKDLFTGENRMTPELSALPSIGSAPEFNKFSPESLKATIGTFTTAKPNELKQIFKKQFGDNVSFRNDSKGNPIVDFPSGSYALNKPGMSPQDIPKIFADLVAYMPAARARTILGSMFGSAVTAATLEGIEASVGGEFSPEEVGVSAALGGAFKGLENLAGAGYRAIMGEVNPEQARLIGESAQAGIPAITSDIIPPQTFAGRTAQQTGEKIPVAGTGGIREAQQEFRERAVEGFTEQFGDFSYDTIIQSLRQKSGGVMRSAGDRLESLGGQLDNIGEIPITQTRRAVADVTEELSRPNVLGGQAALDDLNQLVETISTAPQTYTTLKENRTAFREVVDSLDPTARSQLTSRSKSLLRQVQSGMTEDMRSFARENLSGNNFRRLENANQIYAREAERLTKTRLKNILDKGDFTPENVKQMLFSQKPSEMRSLFRSLTTEGRANARSAIINKITTDLSKRANGMTPNSFATELGKYNPQINAFFKGRDRRALEGLRRGLDATRRAQDASITTPTGQSLIGGLTGFAAFTDLGATLGLGGTAGGLARLYESAPVRNALLRLAGTRQGSTAFERALREANVALTSSAQAMKSELEAKE